MSDSGSPLGAGGPGPALRSRPEEGLGDGSTSEVVASFTHNMPAGRVVFGIDAHRMSLLPELERLGAKKVLALASTSQKAVVGQLAAAMPDGRVKRLEFTRSRPAAGQISRVQALAAREQADCLVAVGSGTVIHAARETALSASLALVVLPTSYAGAEFISPPDAAMGCPTEKPPGEHVSWAGPRVVIYDPTLTLGLPDHVTGRSAMHALAYGVDVLSAPDASPVAAMMAEEGIRQIADGAPDAVLHPQGLVGRSRTQYGCYLTAASLAVTAPGPHRTISDAVARACGLRHADALTVLLPYLLAATGAKRPLDLARVAAALGCNDAVQGFVALARDVGAPQSLRELGIRPAELDAAMEMVRRDEAASRTAQVDPDVMAAVVKNAYDGRCPADL